MTVLSIFIANQIIIFILLEPTTNLTTKKANYTTTQNLPEFLVYLIVTIINGYYLAIFECLVLLAY